MSNCMSIVNDLADEDQATLLDKISELEASGLKPKDAQAAAVESVLSSLEQDEFLESRRSKKVEVPVTIEDTNTTTSLIMPVGSMLDDYSKRIANIERLLKCL